MRLYHANNGRSILYASTLKEAHAFARTAGLGCYGLAFIDEVEVGTDRANLLRILNGAGGYERGTGRCWTLTERGALKLEN